MKTAMLMVWLWIVLSGAASLAAPGNGADSVSVRSPEAESAVEYAARTRVRPEQPVEDPYDGLKAALVNTVLALTAGFAAVSLLHHYMRGRFQQGLASRTLAGPGRKTVPKEAPSPATEPDLPPPRLPSTPRERAEHLRDRRGPHAAAIERLLGRL